MLGIDISPYNILIDGYSASGNQQRASELVDGMKRGGHSPNIVTRNSLIKGLCGNGCSSDAEELMHKMRDEGLRPNVITYNTLSLSYVKRRRR